MATRLDICNMALGEVGEVALTSLGEDSTVAELCRRFIGPAVREVLNRGHWKCARTGAELAKLSLPADEKRGIGWAQAYQLPEDYIRIVSFNEVDSWDRWRELFEVRGDWLLTDLPSVHVVYIRDLSARGEDVHLMPPLLTKAVALALAAKLAWPLQQGRALKESLEQSCEIAIRQAKASGANEEFMPRQNLAQGSRWLGARY